jgi:AI-2 transport protein TqsA
MIGRIAKPRNDPMTADAPPDARKPRWRNPAAVQTVAYVLVAGAAGWFLLVQLAPLLRPLLVAVFLAYVLMPYHSRLRRRVGVPASIVILAGVTAGTLVGLAFAVYASVLGLSEELPRLEGRVTGLTEQADEWVEVNAPWVVDDHGRQKKVEQRVGEQLTAVAQPVLNAVAEGVMEACVVALYLLFLLLEASRLPERVRRAYPPQRAAEILHLAGQVNAAIISYLKAKVAASLVLAVPVGLVLWGFGVRFALLWAVLTFLCNFIPYIGSVIGYTLPTAFAFLWLDAGWQAPTVALLLLGCHVSFATMIEPMILGKAVGLSPLVILGSLAFWGLLWGLPGMFLAVPLTVVAVLVMKHFDLTRPLARLLTDE